MQCWGKSCFTKTLVKGLCNEERKIEKTIHYFVLHFYDIVLLSHHFIWYHAQKGNSANSLWIIDDSVFNQPIQAFFLLRFKQLVMPNAINREVTLPDVNGINNVQDNPFSGHLLDIGKPSSPMWVIYTNKMWMHVIFLVHLKLIYIDWYQYQYLPEEQPNWWHQHSEQQD